jgi:hypothetical protein
MTDVSWRLVRRAVFLAGFRALTRGLARDVARDLVRDLTRDLARDLVLDLTRDLALIPAFRFAAGRFAALRAFLRDFAMVHFPLAESPQ